MEIFFLILIVLAILIIAAKQKTSGKFNYRKQARLFTPAERSFLGVLDLAIGNEYRILGKVRVADVLAPQKGLSRKNWQVAFNRISAKHFDYLLCDPKTLEVKAAVELDDSSHNSKARIKRDTFLEGACESAGLPLIRIKAQRNYQVSAVKEAIAAAFAPPTATEPKPAVTKQKQRKEPSF